MTPRPRDSRPERSPSGRRAASANPGPVAIACFVALILAQRNYEVNSRAIKAADEMLQQTNQMVR